MNKLEEWKTFVDSSGTKNAYLTDKFLSYVFAVFSVALMERKAANRHMLLGLSGLDVF